ncbi:triosephosphate isomerase [Clydaea vesicula]|uniref:Triosephosphate isomerase n=1 Tax=Clydaea vesicula TaxID=447962 RepID=A0AAD5XY50_9FUNG|nr:triosephosphate isomerase [Clydaea vesicula]
MNGNTKLVESLSTLLNDGKWAENTEVVVAPPAPYLALARSKFRSDIGVSAQNISEKDSGAFTGEISHLMLKDLGLVWTILGHSERREIYKESDELIALKTSVALKNGLKVIFCCGEKLEEREAGKTLEVVFRQLKALKSAISETSWGNVVIAYEPVWAIGTGKVATPQQAQDVHHDIRKWLSDNVSSKVAEETRILYGGSVNAGNCKTLQEEKDIDGFLVGGASLKEEFLQICLARS